MKRTLIALALILGATAAAAEPTLDSAQNQVAWKKTPEATSFQTQPRQLVDDQAPSYPFNP